MGRAPRVTQAVVDDKADVVVIPFKFSINVSLGGTALKAGEIAKIPHDLAIDFERSGYGFTIEPMEEEVESND